MTNNAQERLMGAMSRFPRAASRPPSGGQAAVVGWDPGDAGPSPAAQFSGYRAVGAAARRPVGGGSRNFRDLSRMAGLFIR